MASEIHFDGQQFDLWPLALGESVAAKIHFDLQQFEPWREMLNAHIDLIANKSIHRSCDPCGQNFILIANHPIRGGEISSPGQQLDPWTIGPWRQKLILTDRQQFDPSGQMFILMNSITGGPNS